MGAKSGFALKFLQWFIRGVQFLCSAVVLAIFSYFLAVAAQNNITIATWVRAVEGISGVGVVYGAIGLLLLCCLAGIAALSFFAIVLDIAFIGAYVYVAWANRAGAGTCKGRVTGPFGSGPAGQDTQGDGLPSLGHICEMQTACFAVAIVAIFFYILSAFMEVVLVRHHRKEKRFGPGPENNYTSGYGKKKGGFFSRFSRKNKNEAAADPNALPMHPQPNDVRPSYNTDATAVGNDNGYNKHDNSGFRYDGATAQPETGVTNNGYRL